MAAITVCANTEVKRADVGADTDTPGAGRAGAEQAESEDRGNNEFHGSLQGWGEVMD
jgi:hypothetical protein